jgi:hypothetical protein
MPACKDAAQDPDITGIFPFPRRIFPVAMGIDNIP